MARGGYRPNSGPQKGAKYRPRAKKVEQVTQTKTRKKREPKTKVAVIESQAPDKTGDDKPVEKILPLDYMLQVINDPTETDKSRKDRMAIAAAPFCHPRKGEGAGKKEEKSGRAKSAGAGKFAPSKPPLALVK